MTDRQSSRLLLGCALSVLALAGCTQLLHLADTAEPCGERFSEDRCGAIAERVASDLDLPLESIASLDILPNPDQDAPTLGGPSVHVRVHLADGMNRDAVIQCPGISAMFSPPCMDDPAVRVASATVNGYRDVPCADADGNGCATPLPAIRADSATDARPITVARLDIPIDHVGRFEVVIGQGSVPNGILTESSFQMVDDWPDEMSVEGAVVLLDVRSLESDGKPFDNYYLHGWRPGVERIEAVLVFEVARAEPGAVLSIRDVVVR